MRAGLNLHSYAGKTVLGIGAHPDDLELGVGGTLARLARAGARVVMAVVSVPPPYETRLKEAQRAAAIIGGELRILRADACGRVEDIKTYQLVDQLGELVRELAPAAMLTHGLANFHQDHILVYNACVALQSQGFFDLFCYHPTNVRPVPIPFHPQIFVDISETMDLKIKAIHAHASQFHLRGLAADFYRDVARDHGRMAGVPYAEGLQALRVRLA